MGEALLAAAQIAVERVDEHYGRLAGWVCAIVASVLLLIIPVGLALLGFAWLF